MFKQIKSAIFWYYLYKFRKRVLIISFLLLIAFFANSIYEDIVQYLTLKEKLEYLEIILLGKWAIIIFNILISVYLILTIFKKKQKDIPEEKMEVKDKKFTKREEEFLEKKNLRSKADMLVER